MWRCLLETMSLEYVDLLLVHSPIDLENKADQYKALEELKENGLDALKTLKPVASGVAQS